MSLWAEGNTLTLLENGDTFFEAVIEAIGQAKYDIFFETYIYRWDNIGQKLGEALRQAALRSVKVHIVLDGFGSYDFPENVIEEWRHYGIRVHFYQPLKGLWFFKNKAFPRLHRKCIAIDSKIAFVGGINVGDEHLQQFDQAARLDYAVRVEGPLAIRINRRLALFFFRQTKDWKNTVLMFKHPFKTSPAATGPCLAAFVIRGLITRRHVIEKEYLKAIRSAKTSILISNAYFLPGIRFRSALKHACERGVRVRLLLQGLPEFRIVKWATSTMYHELLGYGVEIYEYNSSWLHAKVAVVDDQWATIGSCNLDPLSLSFNLEANVVVQEKDFAKKLHTCLEARIHGESTKIELEPASLVSMMGHLARGVCLFLIRWLVLLAPKK